MSRTITLPPENGWLADGSRVGGWWHEAADGRLVCDLCPRACSLKEGDRGFCFVRENRDGQLVLSTYGRSTGFCVDPIEKKPLNHFLPGTSVLSFGTAGCNLGCKFCQNWDISKSREVARLSERAGPEQIASAARNLGCRSVAYTYNDPVIWAEYAMDCARACREQGIKSVAVTAGYITPQARGPFFREMDAANVDLKAFTEHFYYQLTYSHLQPVLDTLHWLKHETDVWFEITNLIIPQENDSEDELRQLCDWVLGHVGDEVPVHFTAFHPDFRLRERPPTPPSTLLRAYELARRQGLKYVYVGNIHDVAHQSTYCPGCGQLLIERDWHQLGQYHLRQDQCSACGTRIAGRFEQRPGDWGRRRLPVRIQQYAQPQYAQPQYAQPLPVLSNVPQQVRSSMTATSNTGVPAGAPAAPPELSDAQRQAILHAACEYLAATVERGTTEGGGARIPDPNLAGAAGMTVMGAFVTAKRLGRLRGCCGWLGKPMPLHEALRQSAARTAIDDQRMPPITLRELSHLEIDVTILAGFQQVMVGGRERIREVVIGKHGLQIRRGQQAGLLLPSVAVEHGMDSEEFLRQVCRKAGLPSNAWEAADTQLTTFLGLAVSGPFDAGVAAAHPDRGLPFERSDLERLRDHARQNVASLVAGATPNYYLDGGAEGTVSGVILSVGIPATNQRFELARISIRPGVPLQGTLFQLIEAAAQNLRRLGHSQQTAAQIQVGVTILGHAAMNGTVREPDLRDMDPARHLLAVSEAGRGAWAFNPSATPAELVEEAARQAHVEMPQQAALTTFSALSTESRFCFGNAPQPQQRSGARPAAVAGKFYPADPAQLLTLVDGMLQKADGSPQKWPAAMVPHAGLVYSGQLAARVFKRLALPDTVIILGPKHTRLGVTWAVSPHETWQLPGGQLAADPQLAAELVRAIPGLERDAAAHQQEHAIEVELPFVARLAPKTRVVGITIGGGDLARCQEFAAGLAQVLRGRENPPLLLISSDMNHFATDAENRRLDEIALQAMETLDPARLLETVRKHDISMCGVLPAVIVMETLKQLGQLSRCERVGYATSADVSGDTSRVVGYAGMLLG